MCHVITMRHSPRLIVAPLIAAASSAKLHCNGNAAIPAVDIEPIDSTPVPCLPASVMPDGLTIDATANGRFSCSGNSCSRASRSVNQSLSWLKRGAPLSSLRITPIASS